MALLLLAPGCLSSGHGTIGAVLGQKADGRLFVRDVPKGLGAGQAGLRDGDEIILIEGRDVRDLSEAEVARLLEGEPGEAVRLTVVRGEEILRVTVIRTEAVAYRATRG